MLGELLSQYVWMQAATQLDQRDLGDRLFGYA
jgi:hypothetical protein